MKERPIIFNSEMVRAILDGRKTQTRRICKEHLQIYDSVFSYKRRSEFDFHIKDGLGQIVECPYGKPGDRLWVRETFSLQTNDYSGCEDTFPPFKDGRPIKYVKDGWEAEEVWYQAHYKATDNPPELCCRNENCRQCEDDGYGAHWKPSIHMPRWASRITLEITNVRVERLHWISGEDAKLEGWSNKTLCSPFTWYRNLWKSIYGEESWESNPWAWVVEFKRVEVKK